MTLLRFKVWWERQRYPERWIVNGRVKRLPLRRWVLAKKQWRAH